LFFDDSKLIQAPELLTSVWLNSDEPIQLIDLRGQVVLIYAFQMLCPGCVEHSIPQAKKVHQLFQAYDVQVLGLHTVFEHHAAMTEVSLRAFIHEYRIDFPVGIDRPSENPATSMPQTMSSYAMGGTPTLLMIDQQGHLRKHKMGHEQDLIVGAELMALIDAGNQAK